MIDEIVNYCHEKYKSKPLFCENCDEIFCTKGCKQCLHDIHFTQDCHRNYDCPYMCYYYVCQNIHKYATEMYYMWYDVLSYYYNKNKAFPNLNICSIGCGPCSELIALEECCLKFNLSFPIEFIGFDKEYTWKEIQDYIKVQSSFSDQISFENCDVFDYYNAHDKPNVIVLNYMLSNMLKNSPNGFQQFLHSLYTLFSEMPEGVLLINDINIGIDNTQVRYYYSEIIRSIRLDNNIQPYCFHFADSGKKYYKYGTQRQNSNLIFGVPDDVSLTFDTNTECHSAQLIIVKG